MSGGARFADLSSVAAGIHAQAMPGAASEQAPPGTQQNHSTFWRIDTMTEQDSAVKRRRRQRSRKRASNMDEPLPRWPGDPEHVEAADIDFEAVAHVLANTCRWNGRGRRFFSLAQYALVMSEETEALDEVAGEDRRALALHALLTNARAAWLGDEASDLPASTRAAARARAHGEKVDRAVREAAGLDPALPEEWAEVLHFVALMTESAERCDLGVGGRGFMFPPLRRTIRPLAPEAAAKRWLARLRELGGSPSDGESRHGSTDAGSSGAEEGAAAGAGATASRAAEASP